LATGTAIEVVKSIGAETLVKTDRGQLLVATALLNKKCALASASEAAAKPAANPTAPTASGAPAASGSATANASQSPAVSEAVAQVESLKAAAGATEPARKGNGDSDRGKLKIAVMELKGSQGMPVELTRSLTALIPEVLDKQGPFKALSTQDINQMLAYESIKDQAGCDDVGCLAQIGGALGVDYVVSGSITLVADTYLIQLQLLNIAQARVDGRAAREYKGGPTGLLDEVRAATKLVVRDLMAAHSGQLAVNVSEEGATIRIDGNIAGTSPMPVMTIGSGLHTVAVDKE
jgi:TolB-like protein